MENSEQWKFLVAIKGMGIGVNRLHSTLRRLDSLMLNRQEQEYLALTFGHHHRFVDGIFP